MLIDKLLYLRDKLYNLKSYRRGNEAMYVGRIVYHITWHQQYGLLSCNKSLDRLHEEASILYIEMLNNKILI